MSLSKASQVRKGGVGIGQRQRWSEFSDAFLQRKILPYLVSTFLLHFHILCKQLEVLAVFFLADA